MSKVELKPCPLCGKEAEFSLLLGNNIIVCSECVCAAAGKGFSRQEIADMWNHRVEVTDDGN